MLQIIAWVFGLGLSFGINAPYAADTSYVWWQGIVFAVLLFPGVWLVGLVLPRLTLNLASGAMIGGFLSAGVAVFSQSWSCLVGSLLTGVVGLMTANGQNSRLGG